MKKKQADIIILDKQNNQPPEKNDKPKTPAERFRHFCDLFIFCACALVIGVITGVLDAVFGITLLRITEIREAYPFYFIPFLAVAGLLIFFLYDRFGKETQNGMSLVFERAQHKRKDIRLRLIPFVTLSTWLTHLFGGSAGREGVAVQIGGTTGSFIARRLRMKNTQAGKILTITGMASGFSGLFRTPMAAVFFASEVLSAGKLEVNALLPALIGAYTASFVSGLIGLEKFAFIPTEKLNADPWTIAVLCLAGVIFGLVGGGFALLLGEAKKLAARAFKNPYIRIAVTGAFISLVSLTLYAGRYSGLGTNLINASLNGGNVYWWDFAVKFLLTIITLSAGYQGGEVTPLFSIGATLGVILGMIFNMPVAVMAALGYAAVFGAATNTLIAPMFIGIEVFGYEYMPYFFAICSLAYIFNGNNSIYSMQKRDTTLHIITTKSIKSDKKQ